MSGKSGRSPPGLPKASSFLRRGAGHIVSMIPMLLGAIAVLLFILFIVSFYEALFVESWMTEGNYGLIVSSAVPYLELSALFFAFSFALLRPNRNRLLFAVLGAAVASYAIVNTIQYAGLKALTWQGWSQALFITIVVPLSLGLLMIVGIPFLEEASRMQMVEKFISGLSLNMPNLEEIAVNLEKLSRRLESLSSIRYPLEDLASLREQIKAISEQVRGLKTEMGKVTPSPNVTAGRWTRRGLGAISLKPSQALSKTQARVPSTQPPEAPPPPTPPSPSIAISKPGLPDCAKDNPWTEILARRKTEEKKLN
jgi:hypothetical protein